MIIHLNGFPGVGKLTIAQAMHDIAAEGLKKMDAGGNTHTASERPALRILHNHLFLNLVSAGIARGHPGRDKVVLDVTRATLEALVEAKVEDDFVVTNALEASFETDHQRLGAVEAFAGALNRPFVPVVLTCRVDEHLARLTNPERATMNKLIRADIMKGYLDAGAAVIDLVGHPNRLLLEVGNLAPREAAAHILGHARACAGRMAPKIVRP